MKGAKTSGKDAKDSKKRISVKEQNVKKKQAKPAGKSKDPNKPKRAPSAFFVFLEDFREMYKKEHPNTKGVTEVGKACGEKWKKMSDVEKAPYVKKAAQKKAEYEKALASYHKNGGATDQENGGSEKSTSEVNDEEEEDD